MSLLIRLRYSLYLSAVGASAIGLFVAIASADVIALLPISAFDALFNPAFGLAVYATAFLVAPWVSAHLPIKRGDK